MEKERRLAAMQDSVARYEAEFGVITEREMAAQLRTDREAAVVVTRSDKRTSPTKTHGAA